MLLNLGPLVIRRAAEISEINTKRINEHIKYIEISDWLGGTIECYS